MHVTLLVPDLFWPRNDSAPYRGLDLPALAVLLARARRRSFPPTSLEAWLCKAFEVGRQHDWPVAPMTYEFDGGSPGGDFWLRADPVHLLVSRDRLTLLDPGILRPSPEESHELVDLLNRQFAGDGLFFHAPWPERWYLRAPGTPRLATQELSQAAGRDVAGALPTGEDSLYWRRTLTEIQMLLHEHPVNQRREARGELPINSVWLWGGGRRAPVRGQHFSHVAGENSLALALAARSGAEALDNARLPGERAARVLIAIETPGGRYGDDERWRQALVELERFWCAPLLASLRRRTVEHLALVTLHPDGCDRFEVASTDLLKFWRVVRPIRSHVPGGAS
ncbi:MAG TPA: hypothetical protein VMN03_12130 [Burkholderiales bacterium]|nr:hypothetical protein [Burkholderiales bacterium]